MNTSYYDSVNAFRVSVRREGPSKMLTILSKLGWIRKETALH